MISGDMMQALKFGHRYPHSHQQVVRFLVMDKVLQLLRANYMHLVVLRPFSLQASNGYVCNVY